MSAAYNGSRLSLDEWQRLIAGPAEAARPGWKLLCSCPGAESAYQLAELPSVGWAVKVRCSYETGDKHTMQVPWRPFPTEAECMDFVTAQARSHFGTELHGDAEGQGRARRRMLEALDCLAGGGRPGSEARVAGIRQAPVQKPLFEL